MQPSLVVHAQTELDAPWGERVQVDTDMVKLCLAIWDLGAQTRYSCQGEHPEIGGYITLADEASARPVLARLLGAGIKLRPPCRYQLSSGQSYWGAQEPKAFDCDACPDIEDLSSNRYRVGFPLGQQNVL